MKQELKRLLKKFKNIFSKKIPVPFPVFEGNLLQNRVALITGGSSGIGYSIAESYLKNGASVIIVGRNKKKLLLSVNSLKKYVKKGCFIKEFEMDISEIDNIKKIFEVILEDIEDRKIDILVNNAGIQFGESIGTTKIEDFEKIIRTNIEGTYFLSQVVFNYMKKNRINGNILNIASSSSLRPATNAYSISKWAIAGFTKGLAKKCIDYGIVVNGIAPGPTATEMLIKSDAQGIELLNSPSKRYIMPEEVANISTILVSDMGKMIVGDIIYITGGAGIITYDDIEY